MTRLLANLLIVVLLSPASPATAQVPGDVWRTFASRVDVGTELQVRLHNGQRFRAILVGITDDGVLLQPKTRVTVPVQSVRYDAIATLERRSNGGVGAGKAAAIGVATGAGAFFAMMLIVFATLGD